MGCQTDERVLTHQPLDAAAAESLFRASLNCSHSTTCWQGGLSKPLHPALRAEHGWSKWDPASDLCPMVHQHTRGGVCQAVCTADRLTDQHDLDGQTNKTAFGTKRVLLPGNDSFTSKSLSHTASQQWRTSR